MKCRLCLRKVEALHPIQNACSECVRKIKNENKKKRRVRH
ncbi:MAG: hypothetical protein GOVbin4206_125 [Prokaryotic dsDNA virus sp.]|nr:MAG: hypothetical protein GOVbin4206_125 [Prokaryotic dsDNA virus sp.]